MRELLDTLKSLSAGEWILVFIALIILIYFYGYFRFYWLNIMYRKVDLMYHKKRRDYYASITISAYRSLASLKKINKCVSVVREIEDKFIIDPYDFTEYEEIYNDQIKIVNERGYL